MGEKNGDRSGGGITRRSFIKSVGAGSAAVQKAKPLEQNAYKIFLTRGVVEEELQAMARAQGKSS